MEVEGLAADERRPRWGLFAVLALVAVAGAILGVHVVALRRSGTRGATWRALSTEWTLPVLLPVSSPGTPSTAARRACSLLWADGQSALEPATTTAPSRLLGEAYRLDVGNVELLAVFKTAQAEQALDTNRKAHLQHGHEGPGGTLQPEDLER